MKYTELSNKSTDQLQKDLKAMQTKAEELKVKIKLGQHKNVHELSALRKDIARVLTYLRAN